MARAQNYWGLTDVAEESLRHALERNPNHAGAVTGMAIVMMDTGRLAKALPWARRGVAL